ncbi:MAG TPA: hypothetical protein VMZ11_03870 [Mycobacteriales bacterium]|nr:hypothetical protein [Mycobacteriales bacterium]
MSLLHSRARLVLVAGASLSLAAAGLAVGAPGLPSAAPALSTDELRATLRGAAQAPTTERFNTIGDFGGESNELRTALEQYAQARTAPGVVAPGAYGAAYDQLKGLTPAGSAAELTTRPYDSDDLRYRDPVASNSTGGSGLVSGRITGLAVDVAHGKLFAAGADGGVFRGTAGAGPTSWTPISDTLPTLSAGDLSYDAGSDTLWYATGEANTGGTSYTGTGVYRLVHPSSGTFTEASRVGGDELESTIINKIRFDGHGKVFAATSRGIWSHSTAGNEAWQFRFTPNPDYLPGHPKANDPSAPYKNLAQDLAIQPGTNGQRMVADIAWRAGDSYNGFYRSDNGGTTWRKVNPAGAINPKEIGNAEFSYSADGKKLYTVVESTFLYTKGVAGGGSVLAGVYASNSGNVDGPWSQIADSKKLASSGSALKQAIGGKGYGPGVQAWYNNFIQVDPANPNHLWLGLEEVFESWNGGSTWTTPGPYWNFSFSCWSFDPAKNTCSKTTHSDQHAIAVGGGRVYVGNDGGAYTRPVHGTLDKYGHANDWRSLNAGLDTLQYYSVAVGTTNDHGLAITGGLQDNGQSLLLDDDARMGSPFGGDGGDSIMDPRPGKGCNILAEYVVLALQVTNNCGRSDGTTPAIRSVDPGDAGARFIAPFTADTTNPDHWLAGGRYVWTQNNGYAIQSGKDWTQAFDTGVGHSITATALQNGVGWVTWCGPCNNAGFTRGVATNAGGAWHQVSLTGVPNRYLAGVTIDPADSTGRTAYAVVNGFSRRFTEGPGAAQGHLFKTTNAGVTWTDAGATLPDVPASSLLIDGGTWYLGTDLGVLTSTNHGATWNRVTGFPYVTVMQIKKGPDGGVYVATHGRGLWRVTAS